MIFPIVGTRYHPPANAIISFLPVGQALELIPEPDNEYDPNAIMVWVNGPEIKTHMTDEIESLLQGYGYSSENLLTEYWHLGYVPREMAAKIHLTCPPTGRFAVGSNGGPRVEIDL